MAESSTSQYEKILQAHGVNTRKYWLVEVIENYCIVTWVGGYDEILPETSGNPSGSALRISLGLRQYFIVHPSSRHNTVTDYKVGTDCTASFWRFLHISHVSQILRYKNFHRLNRFYRYHTFHTFHLLYNIYKSFYKKKWILTKTKTVSAIFIL